MAIDKPLSKFASVLIDRKLIEPGTLIAAEEEARTAGRTIENYLAENKLVPPMALALAMADYLGMAPISLKHFMPSLALLETVPKETLNKLQAVPVVRTGGVLTVAMADPFDIVAIDQLHTITGLHIMPVVAPEEDVRKALEKAFASDSSLDMEDIMKSDDGELEVNSQDDGELESLETMMDKADDRPVIRMVNLILIEALKLRAADIHIEPQEERVRLRYRIDGVLLERPSLPKSLQSAITSRVKILADLDIAEQRLPQDARFRITAMGKAIDVRVSVLPTIFGGKVVMRLLDKGALFPNLAALGLDPAAHEAMSYAIQQPHGIVLVTGPTGSGKTTTLYSCLQEVNKPDVNVTTCEDPVEYQIGGINQVKINEAVGCTFAASLRAILRQDPDVVLIGEIRDDETAEIAIKAALTGHLVLSTLHANHAAAAITRLLDMGMEPFLLCSSVILTQAQRLFRKLCQNCRKEVKIPEETLKDHRVPLDFFEGARTYGPVGCPKCHNLGYRGRGAIMEVLAIDEEVRGAIMRKEIAAEIRDRAAARGMITLRTAALLEVKKGETSLDVAMRVAGSED